MTIAVEEGFKWFGTDEGVLGRTLNVAFFRDANGIPANSDRLYKPWRVQFGEKAITGLIRDHHLSDLIGFALQPVWTRCRRASIRNGRFALSRGAHAGFHRRSQFACSSMEKTPGSITPATAGSFCASFYGLVQSDLDLKGVSPLKRSRRRKRLG